MGIGRNRAGSFERVFPLLIAGSSGRAAYSAAKDSRLASFALTKRFPGRLSTNPKQGSRCRASENRPKQSSMAREGRTPSKRSRCRAAGIHHAPGRPTGIAVFLLQHPQPPHLDHAHPLKLLIPTVEGLFADAHLAADLGHRRALARLRAVGEDLHPAYASA